MEMSDKKGTAYLRLNKREARALLTWFIFQEHANVASYEESEDSTISTEEVALLNKIRSCVRKMSEEPDKYSAMRLAPHYCRVVFDWYTNLPGCLIDDVDADIHASLGMFLDEQNEQEQQVEPEQQSEPEEGI